MTSSALSHVLPLLVSLTFWRKKQRQDKTDASSTGSPEVGRTVEESDAARSREILKVLTLEREILGTALTTIY